MPSTPSITGSADSRRRCRSWVPAVREGRASFAGRWHPPPDLEILPRYSRPDGRSTPLLIAGRGPRMLQLVVRHADSWNTARIGPASQLPPRMEASTRPSLRPGAIPPLEITVGINVVLPEIADEEHPPLEVTLTRSPVRREELGLELGVALSWTMGAGNRTSKAVAWLRAARTRPTRAPVTRRGGSMSSAL